MAKLLLLLFLVIVAGAVWAAKAQTAPQGETLPKGETPLPGPERIERARLSREKIVRQLFRDKKLPYPPREIFLRAFKHEAELELWAREATAEFQLVTTYRVLASSGRPGPKLKEGDRQVPEGVYWIDRFNPESNYHFSLGINYPNATDRLRADPKKPGGDIYIHGSNVSIGCLPIGDESIEELFLTALDTRNRGQQQIPVHIFPARMSGPTWETFHESHESPQPSPPSPQNQPPQNQLPQNWEELKVEYLAFEKSHRLVKPRRNR